MSSSDFRRFGARGRGKWITVYARNGHTFAVIAGLRLDTTAVEYHEARSHLGAALAGHPAGTARI